MGKTSIAWTDETSNPLKVRRIADGKLGWYCRKINPRCLNCYASTMNERQGSNPGRHGTGHAFKLVGAAELEPVLIQKALDTIRRARKPRRWFVCDMTDIALQIGQCPGCGRWLEGLCESCGITPEWKFWPTDYVFQCFDAWREAADNGQTVQILTKRPSQLRRLLSDWRDRRGLRWLPRGWWIGASAGSQDEFDDMLSELIAIHRAFVLWMSIEPQTERVTPSIGQLDYLDWIVQGGESGPGARPFHLEWARTMRDACKAAGVAWFGKQVGSNAWLDGRQFKTADKKGEDPQDWPEDLRVREYPEVAS